MASLSELEESLRMILVGRYIDMAACCIVVFDYFLTLELEVKFIWTSKFNMMKVVYFLNRYNALLDCVFVYLRSTIADTTHCPGLMKAEGVSYILGVYFAEYTFAVRTYVIWQKRRIVWIPLCIFYVTMMIYNFISYYLMLNHTRYLLVPPLNGCLPDFSFSNVWIETMILVIYDAAMVILIGLAAMDMWRSDTRVRLDLFRVLYGEGVLFYVYLLAFSITSLVAVKTSDGLLFIFMARCMRSILASKVILHMRQMAHHQTLPISRRSNASELLYADQQDQLASRA